MSWKAPFEQEWPAPVDDLRDRLGVPVPSMSAAEFARLLLVFLVSMALATAIFQLLT